MIVVVPFRRAVGAAVPATHGKGSVPRLLAPRHGRSRHGIQEFGLHRPVPACQRTRENLGVWTRLSRAVDSRNPGLWPVDLQMLTLM